jgi:hypothetical protein
MAHRGGGHNRRMRYHHILAGGNNASALAWRQRWRIAARQRQRGVCAVSQQALSRSESVQREESGVKTIEENRSENGEKSENGVKTAIASASRVAIGGSLRAASLRVALRGARAAKTLRQSCWAQQSIESGMA